MYCIKYVYLLTREHLCKLIKEKKSEKNCMEIALVKTDIARFNKCLCLRRGGGGNKNDRGTKKREKTVDFTFKCHHHRTLVTYTNAGTIRQ